MRATIMEHESTNPGTERHADAEFVDLPPIVRNELRHAFGATVEVPAYLDIGVVSEFRKQQIVIAGRKRTYKFAGIAAGLALIVGTMSYIRRPATSRDDLASHAIPGISAPDKRGLPAPSDPGARLAMAELGVESATNRAPALMKDALIARFAKVDVNHDGVVDILDPFKLAKLTLGGSVLVESIALAKQSVAAQLAADLAERKSETGSAGVGKSKDSIATGEHAATDSDAAALAYLSTLDVTWDITMDGAIDQADVAALAGSVVRLAGAGENT